MKGEDRSTMSENGFREVIIVGGGPAGYTAALYAARGNLRPLVIEGFNWGGQLMITSDVENYPGYAEGIMGPEMMQDFRRQAERFGAEFITDDVTRVDFSERPFRVWVEDDEDRVDHERRRGRGARRPARDRRSATRREHGRDVGDRRGWAFCGDWARSEHRTLPRPARP